MGSISLTGLLLALACAGCEALAPLAPLNEQEPSHEPCDALPASKVLSTGDAKVEWGVARVGLPGSNECLYMDKTEVTAGDYSAWLKERPAFADWDRLHCADWKQGGASDPISNADDECALAIPSNEYAPFADDKPMRCVDWCDAEAFCRDQRGGRLCYRQGAGGTVYPPNRADEWPSACSNAGATVWPWGDDADEHACNVGQGSQGCVAQGFNCGPVAVGSEQGCRNQRGIADLIGNVREWTASCDNTEVSSPEAKCFALGGGYQDDLAGLGCNRYFSTSERQGGRSPQIGLRCCYDLTAQERADAGLP